MIRCQNSLNQTLNLHWLTLFFDAEPFHSQEWSMSNFSCSLTRNITPHSMKNLAVHSLLSWQMIILPILTTSLIRFSFEGLGECSFKTWEWKGSHSSGEVPGVLHIGLRSFLVRKWGHGSTANPFGGYDNNYGSALLILIAEPKQ